MLADFLKLLRIRAEVYHNAKVCGNWVMNAKATGNSCFHMSTLGDCILSVHDAKINLYESDLVIFPREIKHSLHPVAPLEGPQQHLSYQCNSEGNGVLCGRFEFSHAGYQHLLDILPEYLIIKRQDCQSWLPSLHALILKESQENSAQSSVLLDRLCEMVFIYSLMHFIESRQAQNNVLALYADKKVVRAIQAFHKSPALPWTIEALASECAMSRTRFSQYFKSTSGWTVMQYLTWWRMQLAQCYLNNGYTVADIPSRVGYESEAAFGRAFKKIFGHSPSKMKPLMK